jgi:DNA polymerase-4
MPVRHILDIRWMIWLILERMFESRYAAYQLLKGSNIDLREIPSCIGESEASRLGIVLVKSIPTKNMGVETGSSLRDALSVCPNLVIVTPNYNLYMKASSAMVDIFKEYSPYVQRFSIDEFLLTILIWTRIWDHQFKLHMTLASH